MMWSTMLALLCGAGLVASAPQSINGRASSDLPVEHRVKDGESEDSFGLLMEEILASRTASAVDEILSGVTSVFGGFVDDIGDFFVTNVKELPGAIDRISHDVGVAMENGEENVVIIVKGVRDTVNKTGDAIANAVTRIADAANSSKTRSSIQELENSIRVLIARTGSIFLHNAEKIDTAIADGIRTVTRMDGTSSISNIRSEPQVPKIIYEDLPEEQPHAAENEVRSL